MKKIFGTIFPLILALAVLSCHLPAYAATLSPQDRQALGQPHGRLFYLYSGTFNVNTHAQVLKAHELIDTEQDFPLAIAILNQVLALDNKDAEAFLLRAIAYTETNEFDKAEADYLNALRLEPENPTFFGYRGRSFRLWQDYAEQKGIDYGWDGTRPNRLAEAERMYKKALSIEPYYLDGIVGLGDTYARMGKWGKKKFVRNLPKAAAFYAQAIDEYNKVLALFPNHGTVIAKKQDAEAEKAAIEETVRENTRRRAIEAQIR